MQIIDFSKIKFGKITPTDIDGIIDYKNRLWIIIEMKYGNAKLPFGQRLALERLCDDLASGGKQAIVFIARHFVDNADNEIPAEKTVVSEYRYDGTWRSAPTDWFLSDAVNGFVEKYG